MVSTFHGLETGKRGLMVGQASISTTGNNIANAGTKGYSRQIVNQSASPSLNVWTNGSVNPGQLGSGVSLDSITRVRDRFLDNQFRDQSSVLGESQAKQVAFDRLETIINEPSDSGLNSAMDELASAWQDLANDPDSASAQAVVKQRAQAFVEVAQSMNTSIDNLKTDLKLQTDGAVSEVNAYAKQIAELNNSIQRTGGQSNDLLDQRDAAVEALSKLVPITVQEKDGMYNISFTKTATAEDGTVNKTSVPLVSAENNVSKAAEITDPAGITGGKIGGLLESAVTVQGYQDDLEGVATDFAAANGNLFSNNASIAELEVDFAAKPAVPDGLNEALTGVKTSYGELVSTLGAQSQSATRSVTNFEAALQATENRRQSVSGVSLDEEMANLVKFQHSYSAAARLISTADEMLDTIINQMAR